MHIPPYLFVASHHDPGLAGMQQRIRENVEQELGGIPELFLNRGRVHNVDNAPDTCLVLIHNLHSESFVPGHIDQGQGTTARNRVRACKNKGIAM